MSALFTFYLQIFLSILKKICFNNNQDQGNWLQTVAVPKQKPWQNRQTKRTVGTLVTFLGKALNSVGIAETKDNAFVKARAFYFARFSLCESDIFFANAICSYGCDMLLAQRGLYWNIMSFG